ncbi:MAG: DarT ssDNA thymidine ADP-ribosyltransferase family protein [Bacteroidota bacterium]|nr:DarT ssDNA thymidine ADP-ribosyltransferase family protein [Bacteroidota bacterium]
MTKIQKTCRDRRITRLCHFTQSRNLAHILGDSKCILSTQSLQVADLPHNPTDQNRWDGCKDLICCSVEFPNVYYFDKVRRKDRLFKDWVVLMIKPNFLWMPGTKFCPTNAATKYGSCIRGGHEAFRSLFRTTAPGISFNRDKTHLQCAPTNIQAEVLVPGPIPLDDITAIAVADKDQARREICRVLLQGLSIDKDLFVVPDFYKRRRLAEVIQRGDRPTETIFDKVGDHAQ